jgi:hypothetical protein
MAVPTFHSIAVVDIERFGPRTNPFPASLRRAMYETLREAINTACRLVDAAPLREALTNAPDAIIIINNGPTTVQGGPIADDKIVGFR